MRKNIKKYKIKKCKYCGYEWIPRKDCPTACPRCKRYLWIGKRGLKNAGKS